MTERKIMFRADVFAFVARTGAAALAGKPSPSIDWSGDVMRAEDMEDAMEAFARAVAERFDKVPDEVSGDVMVQETIRHQIDTIMADAALHMRETIAKLKDGAEGG